MVRLDMYEPSALEWLTFPRSIWSLCYNRRLAVESGRKVVCQHLAGPRGLSDFSAWAELLEPGFDIEHWCAVYGV